MVARPHPEAREGSGDGDARATLPGPRAVLGERLGQDAQPRDDAGDRRAAHGDPGSIGARAGPAGGGVMHARQTRRPMSQRIEAVVK